VTVRCTSVQPKQIINSCWKDRKESQYSSVEVALDGVELHNFTVAVVKYECENKEFQECYVVLAVFVMLVFILFPLLLLLLYLMQCFLSWLL